MSETDERFLERVREEAERVLGSGLRVERLTTTDEPTGVRVSMVLDTPGGPYVIDAHGATLLDAAGELINRLPEERLALAFRRLVAEEGYAKQHG